MFSTIEGDISKEVLRELLGKSIKKGKVSKVKRKRTLQKEEFTSKFTIA